MLEIIANDKKRHILLRLSHYYPMAINGFNKIRKIRVR